MSDDIRLTPVNPPTGAPQTIIIQSPPTMFGRFGKWLFAALVLAVVFIISLYSNYHSYFSPPNAPVEKYHSLSKVAAKKIAVIDVSGPIMEGEDSFAKRQIDRVREDTSIIALVVRINSPGGTITGSDYIYHHLVALKEQREKTADHFPIVVSMGSLCASGGYYVAMAVGDEKDAIYAEPTTWTGSIGVIIPHFDVSDTLESLGISEDSIASHPLKDMGTPTRPMTEEERKILQTLVDESFKEFKQIVAAGRPKFKDDPAALDAIATGQIFTAKQALDNGLVDKIGFIEQAIERAAQLAKQKTGDVRCIEYEEQPTLIGSLTGTNAKAPSRPAVDASSILNLTTPRAYYLWSWLPAAMSSSR